ncbi:MAG: TonB-dependent receptor plug domain-containing protein [Bacteroidota bacterium]|nr:TonB-dependent receptor plug domain-containing protein [Bacteroidota bacterium]
MKYFILIFCLVITTNVYSQNTFKAVIKDSETKEPLIGATAVVQGTTHGASAAINGFIEIKNILDGKQIIVFSFIGYNQRTDTLNFPLTQTEPTEYFLASSAKEMEEVVVSATRSSRTIDDIPTRVETISAAELEEKTSMQPSNIKMVLTESTGIQTQQTSATSANASIRIQGLDGKYTQLLKDGFPLYSGFSGGLSIVQIPPLDLKQVEVIKGAASTLYGGGAIAGLINFVTKVPTEKKELTFLVNTNNTKALDISGYYSQNFKKIGITLFASQNSQAAYDANKDILSDIPKFRRYNINPRLFYYINPTTTISLCVNTSFENRLGGDMKLINDKFDSLHSYFERNISNRISTQLKFEKLFTNKSILTFKNSVGYFDRSINKSDYLFSGKQVSSFSEINYLIPKNKLEWVFGGNFWTDNFKQTNTTLFPLSSNLLIVGAFAQNSFKANEKFILETGVRIDVSNQNRFFVLPKISALYKFTNKISSRISGGLGYKTPTIFSEEAEEKGFRNIQPLNFAKVKAENSIGGSFDVNYRTSLFNKLSFSINQLFFYTRLNNPLILANAVLSNGNYGFKNANGYLDSKGFETNLKLGYDEFSLYFGYTFIEAIRHYDIIQTINPLTAKHRIYMTLMYEIEDQLRIGYELFYTGQQHLSNGETRPDYWVMGISAEWKFKHFSLFVNAENFTDIRQARYEQIYTGSLQNPQFKEIWSPTDGFIFNSGFKITL